MRCCEEVNPAKQHLPAMVKLSMSGYGTRSIAQRFGISAATVRRWILEAGFDMGGPGRKLQITAEYTEICKSMREQGLEWEDISKKIGFSVRQLQRHLYGK